MNARGLVSGASARSLVSSASARILVMMSGSVSAYKVCHVLSRLKQAGHEVEVVASPWALKFVGEATIEGLTGRPVHKSMFGTGAHMSHINLIRWADVAIICPATANTINKLANGIGDDLITTLFLAHDFAKPWLVAPAMNTKMYHHPVTRASVDRLRAMGCEILETASGVLACGEIGDGKLLDSELLLAEVLKRIPVDLTLARSKQAVPSMANGTSSQTRPRILITSGGTSEPIDPVRSITNTSTGKTGAQLAEAFLGLGYDVTFLSAKGAAQPAVEELGARDHFEVKTFITFHDLARELETALKANHYLAVVHAAAVSDYSVKGGASKTKNDSSNEMTLELVKNPKLLDSIRPWSKNKNVQVVAFKLTATEDLGDRAARLERLMKSSRPNFIVANDQFELPAWTLHKLGAGVIHQSSSREDLGFALESALAQEFKNDSVS